MAAQVRLAPVCLESERRQLYQGPGHWRYGNEWQVRSIPTGPRRRGMWNTMVLATPPVWLLFKAQPPCPTQHTVRRQPFFGISLTWAVGSG